MIKITKNELEGQYAAPMEYPVCTGNPAPWLILEMRIDYGDCQNIALFIRGENSMWFRANRCIIGLKHELEEWIAQKELDGRLVPFTYNTSQF